MSDQPDTKIDELTGRAKEAAGVITDNDELQAEGRDDQRASEAKSFVDKAADKAKNTIDEVKSRFSR